MGLLNDMYGNPDTATALGLLGVGLMQGNAPKGFGNAITYFDQAKDRNLRNSLLNMQISNMSSEMDLRRQQLAKQQQLQDMLTNMFGPKPASSAPAVLGQLGSGSFGAVPPPAGMPSIPQPANGGGQSRVGSLSPDALAMLKANGLDLTDVYKLSQPDMQVNNGYAYDRRKLQPGFMPGYSVSQSGQAQMTTIGPDGLPRVSAPAGALDTYGAYKRMDAGIAAANDLVQVQAPDGSMRFVPKSTVLQGQPAPSPSMPTPRASSGASVTPADADRYAILTQELAKAQAAGNTGDAAALQREIARLPPSVRASTSQNVAVMPFQATPTTAQAAETAATKINAEEVAKQIADQRKNIMSADFAAPTNIAKYERIGQLLQNVDGGKFTPTGTEFASALNSIGIKIDKNLGNKQAAMAMANEAALQLRNPAGGAGMPGAMSDQDRAFLASMTPNLAQSADGRKQIIQSYIAVQKRNQQVAQFARKYEQKYGRLDNGFFDQLSAWSNANPLFRTK